MDLDLTTEKNTDNSPTDLLEGNYSDRLLSLSGSTIFNFFLEIKRKLIIGWY